MNQIDHHVDSEQCCFGWLWNLSLMLAKLMTSEKFIYKMCLNDFWSIRLENGAQITLEIKNDPTICIV